MIIEPKATKVLKRVEIKTDPLLGKKVKVVEPVDGVPDLDLAIFDCGEKNLDQIFTVKSVTYHPYPPYPHFVANVVESNELQFDTAWLEEQDA